MNTQTQEALKMAIEALDTLMMEKGSIYQQALNACKEALEQPAKNIRDSFNEMLEDKVAYYKGEQPAQEYLTRAQQVIRANNSAQEPVAFVWLERDEVMPILGLHGYTLTSSMYYFLDDLFSKIAEKNTHPAPACSCKDKK